VRLAVREHPSRLPRPPREIVVAIEELEDRFPPLREELPAFLRERSGVPRTVDLVERDEERIAHRDTEVAARDVGRCDRVSRAMQAAEHREHFAAIVVRLVFAEGR
jgi:hypothetical protein